MDSVVFLDFDDVLNCGAHRKAVVERLGITSMHAYPVATQETGRVAGQHLRQTIRSVSSAGWVA